MEIFTAFAGELESSIAWGSGGFTTLCGAVARVQRNVSRRYPRPQYQVTAFVPEADLPLRVAPRAPPLLAEGVVARAWLSELEGAPDLSLQTLSSEG